SSAQLPSDVEGFDRIQLAGLLYVIGKRFPLEKLHCEEIDLAIFGLRGVNLIDEANVGVANFESAFQLRREETLEAGFRRLDGDAQVALAVDGFINDAHATFPDGTHNFETAFNDFTRLERTSDHGVGNEGLLEEGS